jgi:hypothetical protein
MPANTPEDCAPHCEVLQKDALEALGLAVQTTYLQKKLTIAKLQDGREKPVAFELQSGSAPILGFLSMTVPVGTSSFIAGFGSHKDRMFIHRITRLLEARVGESRSNSSGVGSAAAGATLFWATIVGIGGYTPLTKRGTPTGDDASFESASFKIALNNFAYFIRRDDQTALAATEANAFNAEAEAEFTAARKKLIVDLAERIRLLLALKPTELIYVRKQLAKRLESGLNPKRESGAMEVRFADILASSGVDLAGRLAALDAVVAAVKDLNPEQRKTLQVTHIGAYYDLLIAHANGMALGMAEAGDALGNSESAKEKALSDLYIHHAKELEKFIDRLKGHRALVAEGKK